MRSYLPGYHKIIGRTITKRLLAVLAHCPSPSAILATAMQELAAIGIANRHTVGMPFAGKMH